ncbi:putative transporter [Arthroderma uncinatum]|uniref:putative transporter n=1 Tax=Arthroderma uncinatum TaxID=74035 RepID=UPI00144A8D12|nr:putative transporter [Arthroderma uncinatum]KAF3482250.1 putative transporter [Arthroderma uncinatum]
MSACPLEPVAKSASASAAPSTDLEDGEKCNPLVRSGADDSSTDPNGIGWDTDDPENPLHWSPPKKLLHIVLVSFFTFISNLAATMFAPGAKELSAEFHVTDSMIEAMTVLGPAIGGFIMQYAGWRWTFRILFILAGVLGIGTAIFMKETNAAILLQRKAERIQRETGNANLAPKRSKREARRQLLHNIIRPVKMLVFSPIVLLLCLYAGIVYGLIFLLFTTFPHVFQGTYGFNSGTSGLAYLGLGFGMMLGLVVFYLSSDKLLEQKQGNCDIKPEQRLILMKWFGPLTPLGCFIYGWSAYYHTHWIVPILGTFVIGFAALFVVIPGQIYLVDAFGAQGAASALAASLLVRSPFGAFLDLAAPPLYRTLGLGWGNSVLGFIILAFTPVPWLFCRYGEELRTRFAVNI